MISFGVRARSRRLLRFVPDAAGDGGVVMTGRLLMSTCKKAAIAIALAMLAGGVHAQAPAAAQSASGLSYIETAGGAKLRKYSELIRWTHARMMFTRDVQRIAVGRSEILEVELLSGREALMLGKDIGKTSVIVWYTDGTTESLVFGVTEDLTALRGVLREIDPGIMLELAPDRAALILRGIVPDIDVKTRAETAARLYLDTDGRGTAEILSPSGGAPDAADAPGATPAQGRGRGGRTTVINLLKTVEQPAVLEDRIAGAIGSVSGGVTVRRVMRGSVKDDAVDTFVLEGEVQNQVALTRLLTVAASVLGEGGAGGIRVVGDEGGGLGGSGVGNSGGNVARAKTLSAAGGRILSLIHVRHIPQVRIAVQIHEINRSRLKDWNPELSAVTKNFRQPNADKDAQSPFTDGGTLVGNALQILNGTLTNNIQIASSKVAFDFLFSVLEEEGISRTISSPTLTVLSGEPAVFEVGGQVPVPSTYSPYSGAFGGGGGNSTGGSGGGQTGSVNAVAPGTYSNVEFKKFGVTLDVLPLVDERNTITLDVKPEFSQPDLQLTRQITDATGTNTQTTAFNTRSLETRTQVRDGQPLVIGGLISRSDRDTESYTPGLNRVPLLSPVIKGSGKSDNSTELVIIVTPTVVQKPIDEVALWQYPPLEELMRTSIGLPAPDSLPKGMHPREKGRVVGTDMTEMR